MARNESEREDLLNEATAYHRRVELTSDVLPYMIFAGLHRYGGGSIYFDQDPVFHFDQYHNLRKAFRNGYLYRTQGTTLARLQRHRTDKTSELLRCDLSADDLTLFRLDVEQYLKQFLNMLINHQYQIEGQVPKTDTKLLTDLQLFFEQVLENQIQLAPQIPTRP